MTPAHPDHQRGPTEPGIHRDVPAADYHALDMASRGRLLDIRRSPKHCRHNILNPRPQTPAMALGTAAHLAILQPSLYLSTYSVAGRCCATTGKGEPCVNSGAKRYGNKWLCGIHAKNAGSEDDIEVIGARDAETIDQMRLAVATHPKAADLLDAPGDTELTIIWRDAATGQLCRCRPDRIVTYKGKRVIVDVKTTEDASVDRLPWTMNDYGYDVQGAFYLDGARAAGIPCEYFLYVFVEKSPPYGVFVADLEPATEEVGRATYRPLLERYAQCVRSGEWPGYPTDIGRVGLPEWEIKRRQAQQALRLEW